MGGGSTISQTEQRIAGIKIQTSAYGLVVPVVYGQMRLPVNLIYLTDFTAIAHTSSQSSGGKGGGGVTTTNTTYTYACALAMGVCAGPITAFGKMWQDKDKLTSVVGTTFTGTYGQAAWSYTTSKHPTEAVPYSGLAYIANSAYDMGNSGTVKNTSVEVTGFLPFGGAINDANAAAVVNHMLTDPSVGVGFPSAQMGDYSTASACYAYNAATGLFISPAFTEQKPIREHLDQITKCTNMDFLWSGGLLKLVPYGDQNLTGNGYTFTANTTPQYDLTDNDFLPWGATGDTIGAEAEDPIQVTRSAPSDAWNDVQIEFYDRSMDYNTNIARAKDQANIDKYGIRSASAVTAHFLPTMAEARNVAQLVLQRGLYVRNTYKFRLGWKYCLLEPFDLVTLTDAGLGLSKTTVRIKAIEEDEEGALTVEAEDWPFGTASATLYSAQGNSGYTPNSAVDPGNANAPVIFEPPLSMTNGQQQIWLITSGGANWGGSDVWVSQDNSAYERVGHVLSGGRHGVLSALLPSAPAGDDTTDTLGVDLTVSSGTLTSASASDYAALNSLCYCDGEILAYQTATMTSASKYNLTTLKRGAHGSTPGSHAIGAKFARLDQSVFVIPTPQGMVGKTIYIKLPSVNTLGGGSQSLGAVSAYSYAVQGNGAGALAVVTGVAVTETLTKPLS